MKGGIQSSLSFIIMTGPVVNTGYNRSILFDWPIPVDSPIHCSDISEYDIHLIYLTRLC